MDSVEKEFNKALASNSDSNRGGAMNIESSTMEWEMTNAFDAAEGVNNASPSSTSSTNIVSSVPVDQVEDGMVTVGGDDDMDIESFSFGSESEDDKEATDAARTPELSISFDIKVLQTVMEASAHALDIVIGKDVVMVVGKTGKQPCTHRSLCSVMSTKFINVSTFY